VVKIVLKIIVSLSLPILSLNLRRLIFFLHRFIGETERKVWFSKCDNLQRTWSLSFWLRQTFEKTICIGRRQVNQLKSNLLKYCLYQQCPTLMLESPHYIFLLMSTITQSNLVSIRSSKSFYYALNSIWNIKSKIVKGVFYHETWLFHHLKKQPKIWKWKNCTFNEPFATCGEWRQRWTTLL